ncbi:FtsX-like permease family protein [Clostridium oceanicum]|uniref:ABC transporter permease YtrF n=1 Tax=Clostridium oceanicum TaxID=1543 RepID=A0ABN1JDY8_9CLOT
MKFSDIIEIIWRNLWERKGRTILTMIGVIIGSIAIYVIVSIGNGFQDFTSGKLNSFGDANTITISPYIDNPLDSGSKNIKNKKKILTEKNVNELEKLDFTKYIVPNISTSISASYKKNKLDSLQLSGMKMKNYSKDHELSLGRYPNDSNKNQVVIGQKLAASLLNIKDTSNLKPEELEAILSKKIELKIPEANLPSEKTGQSSNSKDTNISEDNLMKDSQTNSTENSNEEASLSSNEFINNDSDTNKLEDTETKTEPDESNSSNLKESNNQDNLKSGNQLNKNDNVDNSTSKEASKELSSNDNTNTSDSSKNTETVVNSSDLKNSTEDIPIENSLSSNNIKGKTYKVKVVGILKEGMMNDFSMQSSLGLVENILKSKNPEKDFLKEKGYQSIDLVLKDTQSMEKAEKHLKSNGYLYSTLKDAQEQIGSILTGIKLILGSFGGISLLVAAFGIANTMNMSILERKKEIGIMKVVGASVWDVKKIFIGEATAIGFMGGLIGIIIGFLICLLINIPLSAKLSTSTEKVTIISFSIGLVGFVLLFSSFIGFLSGLYPASRAAKLNVIDSIKDQ